MRCLVTGGAGFIGRWVVKRLLEMQYDVTVVDDLSNGQRENLAEFEGNPHLKKVLIGRIEDPTILSELFTDSYDICYHLAAEINVQNSIDNPRDTFARDVEGTFSLLEECKKKQIRFVFMSTCMVYARAQNAEGISETDPTLPASPYAAAKLAGENFTLSYFHAYGLPTTVIRPFNTYGPFQKSSGEGGVIAIFLKLALQGKALKIYGSGTQTRDFLYVEDCANFVIQVGLNDATIGKIINAGSGNDISINALAQMIQSEPELIEHIEHIHPQSEIQKLLCNSQLANNLLQWRPQVTLQEGLQRTQAWIQKQL